MSILHIGTAVSVLLIGIIALYFFNKRSISKFNFAFFTIASFIGAAISLGLSFVGYNWTIKATPNSDDIMNGIGMGVIGAIVGLFLIVSNTAKTNLISALAALLIQFIILGSLYFLVTVFL